MAKVIFFEKPGCINNIRQKELLIKSGHLVVEKNLLEHNWKQDELLNYFKGLPVSSWFNQSAPSIKNGSINTDKLTEKQAIKLMLKDPLLIRRPLMSAKSQHKVGFEFSEIHQWIGLEEKMVEKDLETCPRIHIDD